MGHSHASVLESMFSLRLAPQLKELYFFQVTYSFSYALISILEPVFFFQQGFSFSRIALYYAFHYTLYVLLLPLGGKFASRHGLERSLSVSLPIFVLYFLVLAAMPQVPNLFWGAIVLLTLHKIFFWPAFHADFAIYSDRRNSGTEISWISLFRESVGILGPLSGGFVAAYLGFSVLFVVTAILVLASAIPLLKTREQVHIKSMSYAAPWRIIHSYRHRHMALGMIGHGERLIAMVFWPIFLYIVLGSTQLLGIYTAVTVFVMSVFGVFVGEITDRMQGKFILRLHLPFVVLGNLLRPLATVPILAFLTDMVNRMAFAGVELPMMYRLYHKARQTGAIRYTVAFEMVLAISKAVTAYAVVLIFMFLMPFDGFFVTFFLAAALSVLYVFL